MKHREPRYVKPQVEECNTATEDIMEGSTDNEQNLGDLLNNLGQ